MVWVHAEIDRMDVSQARDEESRTHEQQRRQRDLRPMSVRCKHQSVARTAGASGAEQRSEVAAGGDERRNHRSENSCSERHNGREREESQIQHAFGFGARKKKRPHRRRAPPCERNGAHGARDGEQAALDERLPHQTPARRAERQSKRDFARPREAAKEQQVRDVRAGDEQHEQRHGRDPDRDLRVGARCRAARRDDGTEHGARLSKSLIVSSRALPHLAIRRCDVVRHLPDGGRGFSLREDLEPIGAG